MARSLESGSPLVRKFGHRDTLHPVSKLLEESTKLVAAFQSGCAL